MSPDPAPPSACVILVPIAGTIDPACDEALRHLERRGHTVWRVRGYSAIDAARNPMATDALHQGFDELMWIDSDIAFHPDDVERLRAHNLPITCGLYPKKGPRQFACDFLPGTTTVTFGQHGGLVEVRYCGFGFSHIRREVFESVRDKLKLPTCNQRFGSLLVPFFQPMIVSDGEGHWSLSEDYSFCERARQAGISVMADTRIRLWHVGTYRYGWEDAGSSKERYANYVFHLTSPIPQKGTAEPGVPPPSSGE